MKKIFLILLVMPVLSFAQDSDSLRAEKLHRDYDFDGALKIYHTMLEKAESVADTESIMRRMALSENGKAMMQFTSIPKVVATKRVPFKDFFLYYEHLEDKSWRKGPNPFSESDVYFPSDSRELYFTAPDKSGSYNIYYTELQGDTLWITPSLINEEITSPANELFPMLSTAGKDLYFCSNGLQGMGGYDLFVSHWNEETQDWDAPDNLGFPFSSTANDYFYMDTPDGNYSIFASDRSCGQDSVVIYLIQTENPITKPLSNVAEIRKAADLKVERGISDNGAEEKVESKPVRPQDSLFTSYSALLKKMRSLQSEINRLQNNSSSQELLFVKISELNDVTSKIQEMEMDFLIRGIIVNPDDLTECDETAKKETDLPEYTFAKHSYGSVPSVTVEKAVEEFDYTLKVGPEAVFAEDMTLPEGIVYQIQLFVSSYKIKNMKQLKGLSPVFEKKQPSGKWLYTAGLFRNYKEALENLNIVKKAGFPTAYVVAYENGKSLSINKARQKEAEVIVIREEVRIVN